MPRRLITISYTGLNAGGGVPKFNRDLHSAFPERERVHFCWDDYPWQREVDQRGETEWGRALRLNTYLWSSRRIGPQDVVVADGFWAVGLEHFPLAISHSHGIWSHLTYEDVLAGKQPDMPAHHAAQVSFRTRWRSQLAKPMTAVSGFIADQMRLQWGITVDAVINNGVDTNEYRPSWRACSYLRRPLILHGVNDPSNVNKGWDHIQALIDSGLDADVMSLDDAYDRFQFYSDWPWRKPEVLAQALIFVHPSGYEGNSMMVAEALACGVPIIGYEVGAMADPDASVCGFIMPRSERSPQRTAEMVRFVMEYHFDSLPAHGANARNYAVERLSIDSFRRNWRSYIEGLEATRVA